jgi:hypothetical protein
LSEAIWHILTRNQPLAPKGATDPLAAGLLGSTETGLVGFLFSIYRPFSDPSVSRGRLRTRQAARLRGRCGGVRC